MKDLQIYFSDFFNVDKKIIHDYGAIDISLINDMPLFIDPFLLFNSEKKEYQIIHSNMISYMLFLQEQSLFHQELKRDIYKSWYKFSEVKQTWLGFSLSGNSGRGLGYKFAKQLHKGLQTNFSDFGKETITESSHLEKLCLISPLVGRDKISDFTTNFAKKYLLEYTEAFAKNNLSSNQCELFYIPKVEFSYDTKSWVTKSYTLPCYNGDYVLLTPRDMLTRDETFINQEDMFSRIPHIAASIDDEALRFELNQYLMDVLSDKELTKSDREKSMSGFIASHPQIIDYYIKDKEKHKEEASTISQKEVSEVHCLLNEQLVEIVKLLRANTDFYNEESNSHDEAFKRVMFLKHVIEDMDGYRVFYLNGKPIKRENDLQVMYRLVWYATKYDVNRETNNGRGPVDFKISNGSNDKALVEFKLASNSKLKSNLNNQVEIYKKANDSNRAIKAIMYFSEEEHEKVLKILSELKIQNCNDIILIDASSNKPSASNA